MCVCVCVCACARAWVTLLYSRKLTEHCKPAIMEKIKVIKIKKKKKETCDVVIHEEYLQYLRWLQRS